MESLLTASGIDKPTKGSDLAALETNPISAEQVCMCMCVCVCVFRNPVEFVGFFVSF